MHNFNAQLFYATAHWILEVELRKIFTKNSVAVLPCELLKCLSVLSCKITGVTYFLCIFSFSNIFQMLYLLANSEEHWTWRSAMWFFLYYLQFLGDVCNLFPPFNGTAMWHHYGVTMVWFKKTNKLLP